MAAPNAPQKLEESVFEETIELLRRCRAALADCVPSSTPKTNVVNRPPRTSQPKVEKKSSPERVEQNDSESVECERGCPADSPPALVNGKLCAESAIEAPVVAQPPAQRIQIVDYENELQMADIMRLITKDLSEPYSIYTYRYFIHNWPKLCLLALDAYNGAYVGAIVCKLDLSRQNRRRGYIAMLAVDESYRRLGIGTRLVQRAITNMQEMGCDEVVLETEVTNLDAMRLYSNLGFIREKRLFRYYLNGVDAFRLKLFFTPQSRALPEVQQPCGNALDVM